MSSVKSVAAMAAPAAADPTALHGSFQRVHSTFCSGSIEKEPSEYFAASPRGRYCSESANVIARLQGK